MDAAQQTGSEDNCYDEEQECNKDLQVFYGDFFKPKTAHAYSHKC
jgi:hypothetical protein